MSFVIALCGSPEQMASSGATKVAIPFGVGVVIGTAANYALTRYVGNPNYRDVF